MNDEAWQRFAQKANAFADELAAAVIRWLDENAPKMKRMIEQLEAWTQTHFHMSVAELADAIERGEITKLDLAARVREHPLSWTSNESEA